MSTYSGSMKSRRPIADLKKHEMRLWSFFVFKLEFALWYPLGIQFEGKLEDESSWLDFD